MRRILMLFIATFGLATTPIAHAATGPTREAGQPPHDPLDPPPDPWEELLGEVPQHLATDEQMAAVRSDQRDRAHDLARRDLETCINDHGRSIQCLNLYYVAIDTAMHVASVIDAEHMARSALDVVQSNHAGMGSDASFIHVMLAQTLVAQGRFDKAERALRAPLSWPGLDKDAYLPTLELAKLLASRDRHAEALPLFRAAFAMLDEGAAVNRTPDEILTMETTPLAVTELALPGHREAALDRLRSISAAFHRAALWQPHEFHAPKTREQMMFRAIVQASWSIAHGER